MPDITSWSHHNPVRVVRAPLEELARHVVAGHVLLVTTPGFMRRGVVERVRAILASCIVTVWDGVKANPDIADLDAAINSLRPLGIGCVVGLGGGSALDAAKVLATAIPSPLEPTLRQVFRNKATPHWAPRLPLVAIPTTSGTGAEVTPFATVWDHEQRQKHSLLGEFVYPDVALLDGTLTLTLGEEDTLYPALDAMSHALESLWNKNCTPVSRAFAFQALALSKEALPLAMNEPNNLLARCDLQNASVLAGMAISQTHTAIAHAMSYPLTTHFGVPHGLACSYGLSSILQENIKSISLNKTEYDTLMDVHNFLVSIDISKYLKNYNIDESKFQFATKSENERSKNYSGNGLIAKQILYDLIKNK
jgi:alcohol dehydrogenase